MDELLKTQRLTLRRLTPEDAAPIAEHINDLEVARWLTSVPHPYSIEDAHAFLATLEQSSTTFGIRNGGVFMGVVTVAKQLGYWLGRPFWGQGFMTEAATALRDAHFADGADELTSGYLIGNAASSNVLNKLGFEASEVIESFAQSLGRTMLNQQVRLTRERWEALA